ncbi:hypothetical protein [Photobacterium aquimaris]|uniref:hypothetical protein n=1 Tax=Photobacterium aquimaris TaxID=512643 RepID=UPI000A4416E4|nr:hypothetical protein [Photobacterium aquimaris]
MKTSILITKKVKYQLQKKLQEVRVAILCGNKEKLPQLLIELESEQKKFEQSYSKKKG